MPGGYPGAAGAAPGAAPGFSKPGGAVAMSTGIVFLGLGTSKDLRKKAEGAQVDVLCVFKVVVTANVKANLIKNENTIFLYSPAQTKELYDSAPLNNIQVQIARAEQKGDTDLVDAVVTKLFETIDSKYKLGDLPPAKQTPEAVLDRLRTLIGATHENPLPVLAEARMYHTRGLLQDSHLTIAYQKILAVDQLGTQLATGSEEEKKKVIEKWLPKEGFGAGF
jgi:hypothetical protein